LVFFCDDVSWASLFARGLKVEVWYVICERWEYV